MGSITRLTLNPLIGLSVHVVQSTNPTLRCLTGHVIDETYNTLTLFDGLRPRQVSKATTIFDLVSPTGEVARIHGKHLLGLPAERLRRAKKLRW